MLKEANAAKITDINLIIGQFSSIVDELIEFDLMIANGTIADEAVLHFNAFRAR